jgi:four helix bundle protein
MKPTNNLQADDRYYVPVEKLDAYRVACEVLADVQARAGSWQFGKLRDQAERAAVSMFVNLCEGWAYPRRNGNRRKQLHIAYGSAGEVAAAFDAARILRLSAPARCAAAKARCGRLGAMLVAMAR